MAEEISEDRSTRLLIGSWVMRVTSDGVVYYPSNSERGVAGLQIRQHQQPIRPFKELVAANLAGMSRLVDRIESRPVEEIITEEGEYAAFTSFAGVGKADGKPVVAVLAVVCGDDWFDRFDGWMSDPARFEHYIVVARDAVRKHMLVLGRPRARRFYYTAPEGWQALQRDKLVQWFPRDYPKHHSVITVPPAFHGNVMPSPAIEAIIGRRFISFKKARDPGIENVMFNGVGGVFRHDVGHYEVEGLSATHMITAALLDTEKTMTYIIRLETTDAFLEQDRKRLYDMCRSLRPVPIASTKSFDTAGAAALQTMWAE